MDETENKENNNYEIEELVNELNKVREELKESREINRKLVNSIKNKDNSLTEEKEEPETLESFVDSMITKYILKGD